MAVEPEGDRVAERVQKGAAVVVDDALRIAGGAGGVVERDRFPLVRGPAPGELRVALGEQLLIGDLAQTLAARELRIVSVHDSDAALHQL